MLYNLVERQRLLHETAHKKVRNSLSNRDVIVELFI